MRRHRKPRVLWLPVLGQPLGAGETETAPIAGVIGGISNSGAINQDEIVWDGFSLVPDAPSNQDSGLNNTLHDIAQGNAYRLRRVVGKINISWQPTSSPVYGGIRVGFGLMVCKTDPDGFPTTDFSAVNPLVRESQEDPWIFHRTWLLGYSLSGASRTGWDTAPTSTQQFGSVMDGPHIDQKTARVISNDERLFGVIASAPIAAGSGTYDVFYWAQLRLVASLRMSQGNKRNASR